MGDSSRRRTLRQLEQLKDEMESMHKALQETTSRVQSPANEGTGIELEAPVGERSSNDANEMKLRVLKLKIRRIESVMDEIRRLPGNDKDATPKHLTLKAFHSWVQSNEEIYELQSRIIEISVARRERRTKTAIEQTNDPKTKAMDAMQNFFKVDARTIEFRDQLRSFLGVQQPSGRSESGVAIKKTFLDALFSLNAANRSFEGRKLREYARECWSEEDGGERGAHPARYHDFTQALSHFVVDSQASYHQRQLEPQTVQLKVESNLMPAIHKKCMEYVRQRKEDAILSRQCKKYANVTQAQMSIPPQCQSNEPVPYIDAIAQLKATCFCVVPSQKLYGVMKSARSVFSKLAESQQDAVGADDFMDIWCYVVIKADLPELATMCNYMAEYSCQGLTQGEAGYFLSSLQGAAQYILSLKDSDLIPLKHRSFAICCPDETRSCASALFSLSGIISKQSEIEGYKAYAVLPWTINASRPLSVVLVKTGNLEDRAKVTRFSLTDQNEKEFYVIEETLKRGRSGGADFLDTPEGLAIGFKSHNDLPEDVALVPLSSNNPKAQYDRAQLCTRLNRLSIPLPDPIESKPRIYDITEKMQLEMLHSFEAVHQHDDSLELIKESQVHLQHLGYLTLLVQIDGLYSDVMLAAVESFQVAWNAKNSTPGRTDGRLCPETRRRIREEFSAVWKKMTTLGLICATDPLSTFQGDVKTFRHFVSECQKSWGIVVHAPGVLGPKTIREIDRQLTILNPSRPR